ncbi:FxLYD domain-containing protein [Sediminibacterium goheungense]|jgi:hypothetical protein|uniref:Lipoprotein n=1 Tax=Sediminibacterium goheungense TaxID=1086393 RepID=A0A4R6IWQ0_9BACT|nr:FxLYD domain-containing protein [Sediminibacterium goheungense]TDO26807.1 hypothetical protein BC659_2119 [Sediminibacterium goheungense]
MQKITLILALFTLLISCKNDKKEKDFDNSSYETVKESLAEKEKNNPKRFLMVSNSDRKNLIGQTVVKGTISNKATVCWYKDVELRLSFYSKTGVKLDEGLETIYENIGPGKSIKFKTKYFAPKGTDSVAISVNKATGDISAAE